MFSIPTLRLDKSETAHVSLTQLRVPVTSLENNKTIFQHHSTRLILGYFVQLPFVYSFTRQKKTQHLVVRVNLTVYTVYTYL